LQKELLATKYSGTYVNYLFNYYLTRSNRVLYPTCNSLTEIFEAVTRDIDNKKKRKIEKPPADLVANYISANSKGKDAQPVRNQLANSDIPVDSNASSELSDLKCSTMNPLQVSQDPVVIAMNIIIPKTEYQKIGTVGHFSLRQAEVSDSRDIWRLKRFYILTSPMTLCLKD
jgi:hypothetical protein